MPGDDDLRGRLLGAVWREVRGLNEDNVRSIPAARRAIDSGAAPADVVRAMTAASYEVAFRMLYLFSAEHVEEDAGDPSTGWALIPVDFVDDEAVLHSSDALEFMHEDLLGADPTGLQAEDLFA